MDKHIAGLLFAGWLGVILAVLKINVIDRPILFFLAMIPPIITFRIVLDKIWEIYELLKAIRNK